MSQFIETENHTSIYFHIALEARRKKHRKIHRLVKQNGTTQLSLLCLVECKVLDLPELILV